MKTHTRRTLANLRPSRVFSMLLLAAATTVTGCFFAAEDVVVYDPSPPVVVGPGPAPSPPIVYVGDLAMQYDFGGWSCWELGLTDVEFVVQDSFGVVMAEDWGLPCSEGSTILLQGVPLDTYFVDIIARDGWGNAAYGFSGYVTHDRSTTTVWLQLY